MVARLANNMTSDNNRDASKICSVGASDERDSDRARTHGFYTSFSDVRSFAANRSFAQFFRLKIRRKSAGLT